MSTLVGREEELKKLANFYASPKSEFLAIFGRRRIGKTFLIQHFYSQQKGSICFHATGLKDGSLKDQIENFTRVIGKTFYNSVELNRKTKWLDVFEQLTNAFNNIHNNKKIILFLDELPWMATKRSKMLQALDHYWNRYWSIDPRIKLIVCGSTASWILDNLINNKGGLYNRITYQIELSPLNLYESKKFLLKKGIKLNDQQLLRLYMVIGGVPLYLDQISKGLSADQNIDLLCFTKRGLLFNEFNKLFASLFEHYEISEELVRIISKNRYGISQTKLMQKSSKNIGGRLKKRLSELEDAGFISSFIPYGHKEKGIYYRIIDEYTLFYLKWIEPIANNVKRRDKEKGYWLAKQKSHEFEIWSGYAYEELCYKHISQIRKTLNIGPGVEIGTWSYTPPKGSTEMGTQIDLLFDRDDGAITICEIKHSANKFKIDKEYANKLKNKINIFAKKTKTKKQLFLTMITLSGLQPSMYSEEIVDNVVTLGDLIAKFR